MAQLIKKAQKGATIYINGTKKDLTPEQWDAFKAEFGNNPDMVSYFTDSNNISSFRTNDDGTITVNGMPSSTDSRKRRARRADDSNTERLYNFFNGLTTTVKGPNVMSYAGDYNLAYDTDKDGKSTLNRAAGNANAMKRLDAFMSFNPEEWDKLEGFENFADKQALVDYVNTHVKPNYDAMKAALNFGATKEDFNRYKDIFNSLGIYADKKSSGNGEGDGSKPAAGTSAGIFGDYIVHDGNGGFRFKEDTINAFMNSDVMKEYMGKNLWLNNEFIDWAKKNHNMDFSWITPGTGLFRINGKWVDGSKVNSLTGHDKILFDNWVQHNRDTVNGDNSKIVQYWGTNAPYQKYVQNPDWYFNGIEEGTTFIDDTGNYVTPNGERVFLVADKDYLEGNNYDVFGHLLRGGLRTIVLDKDTNLLKDFDISTLKRRDLSNADDLEAYQKYYATGTEGKKYFKTHLKNVNLKTLRESDLIGGGFGLLYDPVHKRYYWKNNNFRNNNADISGPLSDLDTSKHAIEIDQRLAQWISDNWDKIVNETLQYKIDSAVRTPFLRDVSYRVSQGSLPGFDPGDWTFELGGRRFGSDGGNFILYDPQKVKELGHVLEILPSDAVESRQQGGVLAAQKMVAGNLNSTPSPVPLRKIGQEKVIGDGTKLPASDWAEIAALAADIGSLGASFIPGANIASAGIGAVGSVTDFIAQATKDGLDWGDVGRFALNIGLDAATLIPFAGGAAKAAKTAKLIKQSKPLAKWIGMIASGAGASAGLLTAYDNIVNGDDWTIEDIRTVVNGVRGFTNLNRLKGSATKKGKVTDNSAHTFKDTDITISKKEYDEIMELPKDQQAKKMAELIRSRTTDEKILKRLRTKEEAEKVVKEILGDRPNSVKDQKSWDELVVEKQGEKVDKGVEELLKDLDIKLNKQKAETSWKEPSTWDFWHRGGIKGGLEFKPEADTYWSHTRPKNWDDLGWWDRAKWAWNWRTATRDAKFNPDNPRHNKFMGMYGNKLNNWFYKGQPVALNYYNNLIPWFTLDENARESTPTASYYDNTPLYFSYKKGGKVLKGKNNLEDITNKANKSAWNSLQVDNPFISKDPFAEDKAMADAFSAQAYQMSVPEKYTKDDEQVSNEFYRDNASAINQAMKGRDGKQYRKEYEAAFGKKWTPLSEVGEHTTSSKSNLFEDIGKGLTDATRYALSQISARNLEKKKAEAIKASRVQYEMPNMTGPRYDNSAVDHLQAANRHSFAQQILSMPKTSDANRNFAMQNMVAQNQYSAGLQENAAYSKNISQFNAANNEFQNKAAAVRADIATKQRAEDARVAAALKYNEAEGQAIRAQNTQQVLTQLSGDAAKYMYAKNQAQANNKIMEYNQQHENEYNTLLANVRAKYKADNPNISETELATKINADVEYQNALKMLSQKYDAKRAGASNSYYNTFTWRYNSFAPRMQSIPGGVSEIAGRQETMKKGGKMTHLQRLDLESLKHSNKMQVENQKAFLKKLQKEDEQLYKLLLKIVK